MHQKFGPYIPIINPQSRPVRWLSFIILLTDVEEKHALDQGLELVSG